MEPNTTRSSVAETSFEIVKQEPSFFASGSRSESPVVRDGSLSVHGHTTSHFVPSSFLPTMLGTAHMMGGNIFTLEAAPANSLISVPLDGQLWEGLAQPPSWTALGLPECPSVSGFSGFSGQVAALEKTASWPQSEMPFFLPTAGYGLPLPSNNDNCIEFAELSSKYKLAAPSTYNMLGDFGKTKPWHCGDSSMKVGTSIVCMPNLSIEAIKMKEPPLTLPLSQGSGASTKFIGVTQPCLNSRPTEFWASHQEVSLPVKKEPIDVTATCHDLELKSLYNKEDKPNQDAVPNWMPDNSIVSGQSWPWESALKHPERSRNDISDTRIAGRAHCHDQSSSMVINNSNSTPKLSWPLPLPLSSVRAGASSSHSHVTGVTFTNAEKEVIRKDRNLQELLNTDPKKVKRLVSNRICAAKRKAIKDMHMLELERQVQTLQRKRNTKSAELQVSQEQCAELKTKYNELSMRMQELEHQLKLKDGTRIQLFPNRFSTNDRQFLVH
ncbi:unnamed protein product [Urochloa decumbens]|uniref:BZIP domain-containing protein n=1 Tax=Urochloa decumbens TaxID=240449 RepID=A0ABC9B9J5_9POAL